MAYETCPFTNQSCGAQSCKFWSVFIEGQYEKGLCGLKFGFVHAARLIEEFMSGQDRDNMKGGGTSVYGTDFIINVADLTLPPMLKTLHLSKDFIEAIALHPPAITIPTWAAYLAL